MSTGTGLPKVPEIIMDTSVIGITTTVKNDRAVAANITINKATTNNLGVVKPDGDTIIIDSNGVISVNPENISATNIALEDGTSIQDSIAAIQQIIADEETMMETEY